MQGGRAADWSLLESSVALAVVSLFTLIPGGVLVLRILFLMALVAACLWPVGFLRSAPAAPGGGGGDEPFRFVVVGDTQSAGGGSINPLVLPQLITDMNSHSPAFGLFCGDLVAGSSNVDQTKAQWEEWKTATAPFTGERYMCPGNHDLYPSTGALTAWQQTFPWLPSNSPAGEEQITYSFDFGNSRFISVRTDLEGGGSSGPTEQAWLDAELAASGDKDHVFVFSHRPISFSTESNTGGSAGAFWQSMVQSQVRGYFCGHWHRYQPCRLGAGGETWEVILGTGGGWQGFEPIRPYQQVYGFVLVEVDGDTVTAQFYGDADNDGAYDDVLDEFSMTAETLEERRGPVAYYSFDDGTADDQSPADVSKQIDGQTYGDAALMSGGVLGAALQLDGNDDSLEAGSIGDYVLSLNGDVSLSLFARYVTLDAGTWENVLISYGTADYYSEDEETNVSYWLNLQSDLSLHAFWESDDGVNLQRSSSVPAPVSPGVWHHYAMVRDGVAGKLRFYVDGVQLGDARNFSRLPTSGGRGMLYLGSDNDTTSGTFQGMIDEVKVFDRVLSDEEIAALALDPILSVSNMVVGEVGEVQLSRATPNSPVFLLYSVVGGGPLDFSWGTIYVTPPWFRVNLATDAAGTLEQSFGIPLGTEGISLWMQIADLGSQRMSSPAHVVLEAPRPELRFDKGRYSSGENIVASFRRGPGNGDDWIGIYGNLDQPGSVSSTAWFYTNGTQNSGGGAGPTEGTVTFDGSSAPTWPLPAGDYRAYFLCCDGYEVLSRGSFVVE